VSEKTAAYLTFYNPHSLSLRFNGHLPRGPELAGTRTSAFCILLTLRMMEVVLTPAAIGHAKLQSNLTQPTNTQLFTGRMPFLLPNQQ